MSATIRIPRPQRWQTPFGPDMTAADVQRVLSMEPFASMDPVRFPEPLTLEGIVRFDTRIVRYGVGDIVVRAGDYGNSAYLVLSGELRVVLPPGLPGEDLGRSPVAKKSAFSALAQLWRNPDVPEARDVARYMGQPLKPAQDAAETRVFLQDVPGIIDRYSTLAIRAGEIVGEIAALGRTQRIATMLAAEETEILEIRWQGLREIRRRDEAFRKHVENLYRERSLVTHLRETPLFRHLPDDVLGRVADQTLFETFGDFDWHMTYKRFAEDPPEVRLQREPVIVDEGDYADGLLLIRSGFGRVSQRINQGNRTMRYLGRGGVFGLEEILESWGSGRSVPLRSTLRAVGYTDTLRVPTSIIEQYVLPTLSAGELDRIRETLTAVPHAAAEGAATIGQSSGNSRAMDPALLETLVDNHLINGTQAMMINLDRCVRCDACVEACAVGHNNNPRFNRHGKRYGPVMVANACMHCADPVCMIGCPTGAIHRSDSGGQVLINDDTCIGCATCANACPYDNIRMVDVRDHNGDFIRDDSTAKPIRKATKCDLCIDQPGGPACERACPHDALKRMDLRDLDAIADWMAR